MHLTELTSYSLLSRTMGQNMWCEDSGYLGKALHHVTYKLSSHYPVHNVPPAVCILCPILAVRTTALFIGDLFLFFSFTYV